MRFGFAPVGVRRTTTPRRERTPSSCGPGDIDTPDYAARLAAIDGASVPPGDRGDGITPASSSASRPRATRPRPPSCSSAGEVLSTVVSSQIDRHAAYGGVVPEIAGRAHLELLPAVAGRHPGRGRTAAGGAGVDAVAATAGPGLMGALLVGLSEAKALALAWDVPFVAVNHLEGHLFAALLDHPAPAWPLVVALVSGGHSLIVSMEGPGRYRLLGQTLDDAAGEAFDKVARFLGLGYPGGPAIEAAAAAGDPRAFAFPRALLADGLDLSFSGLKTAVLRAVAAHPEAANEDVAASFQQAVVDVLVAKAVRAAVGIGGRGDLPGRRGGGQRAAAPGARDGRGRAGRPRLSAHRGPCAPTTPP